MSLATVYSRAKVGIKAPLVTVETHLANGLPQFTLVGLPEAAVKESKDRVRAALLQAGFEFPRMRITVNLAPADVPKEGSRFDLPIAISILLASKQLSCKNILDYEFAGELGLSGELRAIKGILPIALATQLAQRQLIIPASNVHEAVMVSPLVIYAMNDLQNVFHHLSGQITMLPTPNRIPERVPNPSGCFSQVFGQAHAKRALEIAAAGEHSILMIGPPGTGKTMLASRFNSLLPDLTQQQALEVAAIYSIGQGAHARSLWERPFRRPHHTASAVALVGGGRIPMPGEISLAHHGILFLDELPEFSRYVLEVLREPLESGCIHLSRAAGQAEYPANCQLVAAMNPCPCGYISDPRQTCQCSNQQIQRYRNKLSGPLLDRIDMHIEVPTIDTALLSNFDPNKEESSEKIRERVQVARQRQLSRSERPNAKLLTTEIASFCRLNEDAHELLILALEKLSISARSYHRILKVARSIADLGDSEYIQSSHISEAIQYRKYDRQPSY